MEGPMPLVWQDPEVALIHRGVKVYHTYKDDNIDCCNAYWYSFHMGSEEESFDVRNLRCPHDCVIEEEKWRQRVIRIAIERGELVVPEEFLPACTHENLCVDSYVVTGAAAPVELDRDCSSVQVFGFQFNRLDGDAGKYTFYCEDCGEAFEWEQVKGF
jgi:hypothetical protein